ncbi:MAG: DUF4411 family protein [Methanobrevibacter sp.]|jgi:hypothetical protein|nr:DUF4411 family protein [Candidatus Methanoflexus mossambicus]
METFVIDTNSLIELDRFNKNVFKSLWENINEMCDNKSLFSVMEVYRELEKIDDRIKQYWENKNHIFLELGEEEQIATTQLECFEKFQEYGTNTTNNLWADPYLISYGITKDAIVITEESLNSQPERKIPYVCNQLDITCLNLDSFMEYQNWEW